MRTFCTVLTVLLIASVALSTEKGKRFEYPQPPGIRALDCTDAIPVECGHSGVGENYTAPNNVTTYSCVGWLEDAGEVVYEFVIPPEECQIVTARVTPLGGGLLDVFFLGSCDENDCLAHGDAFLTTTCLESGTYYIVVDGTFGSGDTYVFSVDCEPCGCPGTECCPFEYTCHFVDFNADDGGYWTLPCGGEPVWNWGYDPEIPAVACDDVPVTNLLGTAVGGDYPSGGGEAAVVGPFFLDQYCTCLELCHYYDTEPDFDAGNVKISLDGGATWILITPALLYDGTSHPDQFCIPGEPAFSGHESSDAFLRDCFDISEFVGTEILVGFFFGSDSSNQYPGWYIKWLKIGSNDYSPVEDSSWGSIKAMYR